MAIAFRNQGDSQGLRKFFAFWIVEGRLKVKQQRELDRKLKELDMPEIIDWWVQEGIEKGLEQGLERGLEQGLRQTSLETARKMLDRGYDWSAITDITGIKPEDLATA